MVIVVQPGLRVIELAEEARVVLEGRAEGGGVLVGLGHAEGVGLVPAPDHLVVGGAGDDPWRVQVVGVHVMHAGGDGAGGQGPDRVGGHAAARAGVEPDVDGGGGADCLL